ncbi:PDZ domain-containing protein [Arthrobacter frigidicola]|nr:PDZ domain-containing protein [Arthrobacter frigidicola]
MKGIRMADQFGGPAGPDRPIPPRPANPPTAEQALVADSGRAPEGRTGETAAIPTGGPAAHRQGASEASPQTSYGQSSYGQNSYGQNSYGQNSYGQNSYGQNSFRQGTFGQPVPPAQPPSQPWLQSSGEHASVRVREKKRIGVPAFLAGVLAAGLLGGGIAAGADGLFDGGGTAGSGSGGGRSESVIVNNSDSVNEITAAAVKASPSVVTIAVSGNGSGGSGSGIILDEEGHILTNTHVVTLGGQVADAAVEVKTNDGRVFRAEIVGTDPLSDLAVIKIDAPDLTPAALGNSEELNVGDTAIAIGAPLGLSGTVTDGIISTLNRTISVASSAVPEEQSDAPEQQEGDGFNFLPPDGSQEPQPQSQGSIYLNVIQTDAAINQGNSGGALVDAQGRVIGVNVAIASSGSDESAGNIGVGFSIPISYAERVANDIIENGKATHGFLGVTVEPAAGENASSGSTFSVGAQVAGVEAGSPAADAEIREGDIITKVGDSPIGDPQSLTAAVRMQPVGETVPVEVRRGGDTVTIDVTLAEAPAA